MMNDDRREGCPCPGGWQHFIEKRACGGLAAFFGECFASLFAMDDAERPGTIHAVPLAQPTTES